MPHYYPVFLNLSALPCVVIGGGQVAERKIEGLLEAEAQVTVIGPTLTPTLRELARAGRLRALRRTYQVGDLQGFFVAIAATNNRAVQEAIATEAGERGVLLNVVDEPNLCTFIAPAVVRRGDIVFAISTSGRSPALARWLREELESHFPPQLAGLVELVASLREELRRDSRKVEPELWNAALKDSAVLGLVGEGRHQEARERLLNMLLAEAH